MSAFNGHGGNYCLELILTATGGAELVEHVGRSHKTLWASDTDEDFREEFPDIVADDDVAHVLDYLVDHEVIDEDDADGCEVSLESARGPGDDDDDDDDDEVRAEPIVGEFLPGHGG
jgi:hypothetical protein